MLAEGAGSARPAQRHAEAGPTTREKNLPRTALHAESLSCRSHAGNNRPRRTATATAVIYQASHTQRAGHHSTCCGKTFNGARRAGARAQLTSVPTQRNGKEQKGSGGGRARDAGASGAGPRASAPAKQRNGNITVTVQVVFKRPPAAPRPGLYTLLYSTLDPCVPKGDSHFRGGAGEVSASDSAIRDPHARARPLWRRARQHAGSHFSDDGSSTYSPCCSLLLPLLRRSRLGGTNASAPHRPQSLLLVVLRAQMLTAAAAAAAAFAAWQHCCCCCAHALAAQLLLLLHSQLGGSAAVAALKPWQHWHQHPAQSPGSAGRWTAPHQWG